MGAQAFRPLRLQDDPRQRKAERAADDPAKDHLEGQRAEKAGVLTATTVLVEIDRDAHGRPTIHEDREMDLRDAHLRSALLIRSDLRGQDLGLADLLGADLRDADLSDADLADTLFLCQSQVNAARGNAGTRIPAGLSRPGHWA